VSHQHTPGPWVPMKHPLGHFGIFQQHHAFQVAEVLTRNCSAEMTAANARLIAAAPYMLSVLEDVEANFYAPDPNCSCHLSSPCNDCADYAGQREILSNVRSVIGRATGKDVQP